jgi:hypothetical protein
MESTYKSNHRPVNVYLRFKIAGNFYFKDFKNTLYAGVLFDYLLLNLQNISYFIRHVRLANYIQFWVKIILPEAKQSCQGR